MAKLSYVDGDCKSSCSLSYPLKVGSAGFAIPGHRFAVLDQNYQELPTAVLVFCNGPSTSIDVVSKALWWQ